MKLFKFIYEDAGYDCLKECIIAHVSEEKAVEVAKRLIWELSTKRSRETDLVRTKELFDSEKIKWVELKIDEFTPGELVMESWLDC